MCGERILMAGDNPLNLSAETTGVIDMDEFRIRVGDDSDLIGELITLFLAESPKMATAMRRAALEENAGDLKNAAHALKGCVAIFAAPRAVQAAAVLEEMGIRSDLSHALAAFDVLDSEVDNLRAELTKMMATAAYA